MPIKGLTNRGEEFAQIGQIRKGELIPVKGKPGQTRPTDLDYFRVVFDEEETQAAADFKAAYPDPKPQTLNIFFASDDIDTVWDSWLEAYTASRLVARSDGERFIYLLDYESGEVVVKDGNPYTPVSPGQAAGEEPVGYYTNQKNQRIGIYLKPEGRLKVVIPELARFAYLIFITHSINDIVAIDSQLRGYKATSRGKLAGIPFQLRRRKKNISKPMGEDKSKRTRSPSWLVSIEPHPDWVRAKMLEMSAGAAPQLPDGDSPSYLPPLINGSRPKVVSLQPDPALPAGTHVENIALGPITDENPAGVHVVTSPGEYPLATGLKWDSFTPPVSPKDYTKYYQAATNFMDREQAREILVASGNDAQKAHAAIAKMIKSNPPPWIMDTPQESPQVSGQEAVVLDGELEGWEEETIESEDPQTDDIISRSNAPDHNPLLPDAFDDNWDYAGKDYDPRDDF